MVRNKRLFNFYFFLVSILTLLSAFFSPAFFWGFAVLSLFVPVIVLVNIAGVFYYLLKRSWIVFMPIFVLVIFSFQYLLATLNLSSASSSNKDSFSVLSYNVGAFNRPRKYYFDRFWKGGESPLLSSKGMIDFVVQHPADIKCFQEFYSDSNSVVFNTREQIAGSRRYYVAESTSLLRINRSKFGVAIFSKFPVVSQGELLYAINAFNRGVYADIKVNEDTIRIINVHLQSTQVRFSLSINFFKKWKYDQAKRADQADRLVRFIERSPYPVILCGDFNDTPYGYVYLKFRRYLSNSFENKGSGFGFTYKGKWIRFLRIDNQFFSDELEIKSFETLNSIHFSDHYPIEGIYNHR